MAAAHLRVSVWVERLNGSSYTHVCSGGGEISHVQGKYKQCNGCGPKEAEACTDIQRARARKREGGELREKAARFPHLLLLLLSPEPRKRTKLSHAQTEREEEEEEDLSMRPSVLGGGEGAEFTNFRGFFEKTATQREGKISHFHAFVGGFLTPRPLLAMCAHISISLRSHHDVVPLDLHLLVRQLLALQLQAAVEEDFFTTKS